MRKVQKKQIEELLDLLEQAHQEIKGFVERKEFVKAQELLGQCQESAVQVGELIEMEEGELAPTIAKLENYCEVLYEIYEELSSDTMAMAAKIYKRLQKVLIQVENSVKNEIKPRLEVVFLPYKASMWDSLESVWRAADADKNTDAYVLILTGTRTGVLRKSIMKAANIRSMCRLSVMTSMILNSADLM